MRGRALYLGPADSADHVRAQLGPDWQVDWADDPARVDELIGTVDVVLDAYMRVPFGADRLAAGEKLRLFVTATTGADHVDAKHLEARGIPLLTLKGQRQVLQNITPAAEHSWLLLMACARGLRRAVDEVLAGGWNRNNHPGIMLRGRTLGLVGCGRIGEWMSRYATAFGMRVIGFDPFLEAFPATIEPAALSAVLEQADFVSVHVPLTDETKLLVGAAEIARMKSGAILVNTSRGDIVDEAALADALRGGHLGGYGVDVLTGEPDTAEHPLVQLAREHHNVVITPHVGGFSPDALKFVLAFSCERIRAHFAASHG